MTASDPADTAVAEATAEALRDGLTMRDLAVREPGTGTQRYLQVINPRGMADVLLAPDGTMTWEYRPFAPSPHDPGTTTAIVLAVLGAPASPAGPQPARNPDATLTELLGRAAADHGLTSRPLACPPDGTTSEGTFTETRLANPGRPERGHVTATEDGGILWACRLSHPPASADGTGPAEAASTIARVLTMPPPGPDPAALIRPLQQLDDAMAYRLSRLQMPCTDCTSDRRCDEHASDEHLLDTYKIRYADAFMDAYSILSPDDLDGLLQAGDLPPTAAVIATAIAARFRKTAADGPFITELDGQHVLIELDGDTLLEHPLAPAGGDGPPGASNHFTN